MPDHVRKQIRDQAVTDLTGLTTTGANVFPGRLYPIQDSELPGLLVYTNDEVSEIDNMTRPRGLERSLELIVEGLAAGTTTVEDTLDTIAKEVEAALGNSTLGGLVKDLFLIGSVVEVSGEGKKQTGAIKMTWNAFYRTIENAADAAV